MVGRITVMPIAIPNSTEKNRTQPPSKKDIWNTADP